MQAGESGALADHAASSAASSAARSGAGSSAGSSASGVLAGGVLGALAGAKLFFAANYPALLANEETGSIWWLAAGFSAPGAIAGAWAGVTLAASHHTGAWTDALTPAVLAMLLVLDAGTSLWSLTEPGYGVPARHFGINFGDGVRRHPVMLYDALCLGAMLWANRALQRQGWSISGLRASVLWGGYFAASLLLAFLKPPFGTVLLLEKIHLRPYVYAPGLTAEQWLCIVAAAALAMVSIRAVWRSADRA